MASKCPHCGGKVGRVASKCWKCGGDLGISYTYLDGKDHTGKGGFGLGFAAMLMVISGTLYFIAGLIFLAIEGYYRVCLGDFVVIFVFIGALITFTRANYIVASLCCLFPGIIITIGALLSLNIVLIISMICILAAAQILYKNKDEFT